ncbi:MAG: ABC transporter permease [Pseudobutyrivibrio sp.]|nr:ABC transporter permease [Pseudobutyrivibrio sp.]
MIALEFKKEKRTGITLILFLTGILGALYVLLNFKIRGETLLNMPLDPMDILLTQLYGMIMILNMFALIVTTSIAYSMEFTGTAIKKMYVLPVKMWKIYLAKFLIIVTMLFVAILLQNVALAWIGSTKLPQGQFEVGELVNYSVYTFITSLPVLSFMLMISSFFENIWVTLGIGVAGFLSGMAFATAGSNVKLIHPFIVMFKPAIEMTAQTNVNTIIVALVETIVFLALGIIISEKKKVE